MWRCKCCRYYFEEHDEKGKCPCCHGVHPKFKWSCDDTEWIEEDDWTQEDMIW